MMFVKIPKSPNSFKSGMTDEFHPHYKDFFLYIIILLVAAIGVIFFFSKNYSENTQKKAAPDVEVTNASPSASISASDSAKKK